MMNLIKAILIIGFAFLTVNAQDKKEAVSGKESITKVDPTQELKDQWKSLQAQTLQQEASIKDQALQLQNIHIQMREAKLQMKDIEAKLQSKLCDKGTMLNINAGAGTFSCIAEGKPK